MQDSKDIVKNVNSDLRIWLVKVPNFIIDEWNKTENDGIVGKVRIFDNAEKGPKITFKSLLEEAEDGSELPTDYELKLLPNCKANYIFSDDGNNHVIGIEGCVVHEGHLKPFMSERYQNILKKRAQATGSKNSAQRVNVINDDIPFGMLKHVNDAGLINRRRRPASSEQKRERLPKIELMDLLFTAFEKYPYWNLKGLMDYTKQPMIYLREVLSEIADYEKSGPYKSTYRLKSEYIGKE